MGCLPCFMPYFLCYQEELELAPSERFITEYHEDGRCVLTIKDITFDDEAEYTCQAKNETGVASTFVDIFVESKERALPWVEPKVGLGSPHFGGKFSVVVTEQLLRKQGKRRMLMMNCKTVDHYLQVSQCS